MKKNILIILVIILFTTGCNCEYNLTIHENEFREEINIIAENQEEITDINYNWKMPTDKEEYNIGGDMETKPNYKSDLYEYKINNNILTFNYNFNKTKYKNSSAVSECYDRLTIENYKNTLIISTGVKANCFEKQPQLNRVTVNITVDREVTFSNSDEINGKTYTWYITRNNYNKKPINLTLSNKEKTEELKKELEEKNNIENKNIENKTDYSLYIFAAILLLAMLIVYFLFNKMKNKNNQMDD